MKIHLGHHQRSHEIPAERQHKAFRPLLRVMEHFGFQAASLPQSQVHSHHFYGRARRIFLRPLQHIFPLLFIHQDVVSKKPFLLQPGKTEQTHYGSGGDQHPQHRGNDPASAAGARSGDQSVQTGGIRHGDLLFQAIRTRGGDPAFQATRFRRGDQATQQGYGGCQSPGNVLQGI